MNRKITSFVFTLCSLIALQKGNAQAWLWAKTAGGTGTESATAITTDSSGNIYVAGDFTTSTVAFGAHPVNNTSSGSADVFLVKYDQGGTAVFAKSGGGTSSDHVTAISADTFGNIYVAGYFYSTSVTFGTHTVTNAGPSGTSDMCIVKYDASGTVVWAIGAGGTGDDRINAIKADAMGNIVVTGSFQSANLIFGLDTVKNPLTTVDAVFVIKYDAGGAYQWGTAAGGANYHFGNAITTDAASNVYVAGKFTGTAINFGDSVLTNTNAGSYDMFLVKYNSSGTVQWARHADDAGNAAVTGIGTDASDNVYVCGNFAGSSISFNVTTLINSGGNDIFLAKYNSSGNVVWATANGGSADDIPHSLVVDDSANVLLTGNFASPVLHFGASTVTYDGSGISALFLTKYDAAGNVRWAKTTGASHGNANGIAFAPPSQIYLAGDYSDTTFWFGSDTIQNAIHTGSSDVFVAKYSELDFSYVSALAATESGMTVFPNPNNGSMMVSFKETGYNNIGIYDCTGKLIYQTQLSGNEHNVRINASDLNDGVYMLRTIHNGTAESAAFVIRR